VVARDTQIEWREDGSLAIDAAFPANADGRAVNRRVLGETAWGRQRLILLLAASSSLGVLLRQMLNPERLDPLFAAFMWLLCLLFAGFFASALLVSRFGRGRIVIDSTGIRVDVFVAGHRLGKGSAIPWNRAQAASIVTLEDRAFIVWGPDKPTELLAAGFTADQAERVLAAMESLRQSALGDAPHPPPRSLFGPRLIVAVAWTVGSLVMVWLASSATADVAMYAAMRRSVWTTFLGPIPWLSTWCVLSLALGLPGLVAYAATKSRPWAGVVYAAFVAVSLVVLHWSLVTLPAQQALVRSAGG
jgi:hypothetical protein